MHEEWEVLAAAGLPVGPLRRLPERLADAGRLRRAVSTLAERCDDIDAWQREPLLAWLQAFRQHWPERFGVILGKDGEECLARLSSLPRDANRYLKLRRIAIENLSHML